MQQKWTSCDEDEDVVSMAMTAARRLVERHGMRYHDIGMLQTACESLLDRSKSIKSNLMSLFPPSCCDVEGIDSSSSGNGGTTAVLACLDWLQGPAWDGRWALAICTDAFAVAAGPLLSSGATAVAILLGPDAPLAIEKEHTSHIGCEAASLCHHAIAGADALCIPRGAHPRQSLRDFALRWQAPSHNARWTKVNSQGELRKLSHHR